MTQPREIKFRAWDSANKFMHSEPTVSIDTMVLMAKTENWNLMQYTGLKDKNGKEIYEGDVVSWTRTGNYHVRPLRNLVLWDGDLLAFVMRTIGGTGIKDNSFMGGFRRDYEIIGNIYENEDLLKP